MTEKTEKTETKITFKDLGLSKRTLAAVNAKGFEEPTTIQAMTIPVMLKDESNIIAQAQTGTGKTAAFGLPLIQMIDPESRDVQALILAPTRELAIQVSEEINSLKGDKNIKVMPIYGGQSIDQQLRRLKRGMHIIVGTPGRIIDHLNRRTLKVGSIEHLILDEADEMLNMGFIEDIEEIMEHTNKDKRTLLFSATMPDRIKTLAKKYMDGYELLVVKKERLTTNLTEQIYFEVKHSAKFEALCRIIDIEDNFYGLVFCRTRIDVDTVAAHLNERGYEAEAIHGDISQAQRERTLNKFKAQKSNILVATDVAARGIDVNNLTHVINFALPQDPEAYIHRIGRTGRAGNQGTAITFITPREYRQLMYIQRVTKADIKKSKVPEVADILRAKKKKIYEEITTALEGEVNTEFYGWAKQLLKDTNPTEMLASILSYCFEEELNPKNYGYIEDLSYDSGSRGRDGGRDNSGRGRGRDGGRDNGPRGRGRDRDDRSSRGRQVDLDDQGKTRLFIALGKKDKISLKSLIATIMDKVKIRNRDISDVQVMDKYSFVTVPYDKAEEIISSFKEKGKREVVTHAKKSKR